MDESCQFYKNSKCRLTKQYVKKDYFLSHCIGPYTHFELCILYQTEIATRTRLGGLRKQGATIRGKGFIVFGTRKSK